MKIETLGTINSQKMLKVMVQKIIPMPQNVIVVNSSIFRRLYFNIIYLNKTKLI